MTTAVIYGDDGYTESRHFAEIRGVYGELNIKYRPVSPEGNAFIRDAVNKVSLKENAEVQTYRLHKKFLADKLIEWDATTPKGEPVEIEKGLGSISPTLFVRLVKAVLYNLDGGDEPANRSQGAISDDDLSSITNEFTTIEGQKKI